jgi:very-short-patch-repair endonuclease
VVSVLVWQIMPQFYYTPKQLEVESWINQAGFRTRLEAVTGRYSADIMIDEIQSVVEVDGRQHYKKEIEKRDKVLKEECGIVKILHLPSNIKKKDFDVIFGEWINE